MVQRVRHDLRAEPKPSASLLSPACEVFLDGGSETGVCNDVPPTPSTDEFHTFTATRGKTRRRYYTTTIRSEGM